MSPPRSATDASHASARVAVPAALPGIGAGLLLAWLRAFGEFGATVILAYHPYSLPVFTFVQFDETGLPATMLPIAAALAAALVILLLVGVRRPRRRNVRPAARAVASAPHPPAALDFAVAKRLGSFSLEVSHLAQQSAPGPARSLRCGQDAHPPSAGRTDLRNRERTRQGWPEGARRAARGAPGNRLCAPERRAHAAAHAVAPGHLRRPRAASSRGVVDRSPGIERPRGPLPGRALRRTAAASSACPGVGDRAANPAPR